MVASNDERDLKAPSVVRGQKDDSNSASTTTVDAAQPIMKVNCGGHIAETCFQCTNEVRNSTDRSKCGGDCYWWMSSSGGVCLPYENQSINVSKTLTEVQKTVASPCLRESLSHPVADRDFTGLGSQPYPDLASGRILHDLFSQRVYSGLGHLNNSDTVEAMRGLSFEEKCARSPVPKVSQRVYFHLQPTIKACYIN